jgi:hypothetical protein
MKATSSLKEVSPWAMIKVNLKQLHKSKKPREKKHKTKLRDFVTLTNLKRIKTWTVQD